MEAEGKLWLLEIADELGYHLHLIYNEHSMYDHKYLFEKFDLQRYFK
jgi:hypothetical protein